MPCVLGQQMNCIQTMTRKQVGQCDLLPCAVVTHSTQTCSPVPFEETESTLGRVLLCEDAGQTTKATSERKGGCRDGNM